MGCEVRGGASCYQKAVRSEAHSGSLFGARRPPSQHTRPICSVRRHAFRVYPDQFGRGGPLEPKNDTVRSRKKIGRVYFPCCCSCYSL